MRLLCLSNGHGEDAIAVSILKALQALPQPIHIDVLPIVGEGHAYEKHGFSMIGTVKAMPSGGFIYMDGQQLAKDIQGGLLTLTLEQLKTIRQWAQVAKRSGEPALVLAVGDVVPMFFAWQSGLPFAFVGTAKSDYYLRDESGPLVRSSWWDDRFAYWTGSVYYPWERWFMTRKSCKAMFPRDRITADTLQNLGVPAYNLGNPMMDLDLSWVVQTGSDSALTILLLPGSRSPEVYRNWEVMVAGVQDVCAKFDRSVEFLVALSPGLERDRFERALRQAGWELDSEKLDFEKLDDRAGHEWNFQGPEVVFHLTLGGGSFSEYAYRAEVAIAMAGTATEQFVGLGKPVLTLSGAGPQFTAAFAEAQTRLLGSSVLHLKAPSQIASCLTQLLRNPGELGNIATNGRRRMGPPGAADRIAQTLIEILR